SSGLQCFFRCAMFIYPFYLCYSLSLYPFAEHYAQPYFFSCLIRQKPFDITGVPRSIAEHQLNIRKGCLSVRQKKRGQALDRNKAINEEVSKLVESGSSFPSQQRSYGNQEDKMKEEEEVLERE
nr:reverse transcriptase domain-containing protein [Tanacetum cinerariifolium]